MECGPVKQLAPHQDSTACLCPRRGWSEQLFGISESTSKQALGWRPQAGWGGSEGEGGPGVGVGGGGGEQEGGRWLED